MGGANFLGREVRSIPQTEGQKAFDVFAFWVMGGLVICFGLAMLIFRELNFIPLATYFIVLISLWIRYVKAEKRSED